MVITKKYHNKNDKNEYDKNEYDDKESKSRVGSPWSFEEDNKLITEITENMSYDDIANNHKRTVTGILSRVVSKIIYPLYKDGNKLDILSNKFKIDNDTLSKYISNLENGLPIKSSFQDNNMTDINNKFNIIMDKIICLENKLNDINNNIIMICKINELNNKVDYLLSK